MSPLPYGVDFGAAEQRGIRAMHALALPGRTAPDTAGQIIAQTVCEMLEGGACDG